MRRRGLLSGLLVGVLAILSGAFAVRPLLDLPIDPDEGVEEEPPQQPQPPSTEPPPPEPPPLEPEDDEEERPATEPA